MSQPVEARSERYADAIEVIVMWGQSVLDVKHLSPLRSFVIGDAATDFVVSPTLLNGRTQLPLLVVDAVGDGEEVRLSITPEMRGCVDVDGEALTLEALHERGLLAVSSEVTDAHHYTLPVDASAELHLGELCFVVRRIQALPVIAASNSKIAWDSYGWALGSLAFHGLFLTMFYFLPPSAMARNFDLTNIDRRYVDYVMTPPEVEDVVLPDVVADAASGEDGKAHDGEEGQMGKPSAPPTKKRYAVAGDAKPQDRVLSREEMQAQAKSAGVIGTIRAAVGSWNTPTSPYGADQALGSDAISAMGALLGDNPGDNFGFGGLGMKDPGRGGGGTGEGTIGSGPLGTIGGMGGPGGHGPGGYCGDSSSGYRCGSGFRGRDARNPPVTMGKAEVRGGLAKEAIRRVIHRHLAEVRHCYEQELNARPDLEGRVAVKFMINNSGVVQLANITQSTLGNPRAESCIQQALQRWTFPASEGISMVSYPFMFTRAGE